MRRLLGHLWHWRTALGLALGGALGAIYALTIGCHTGTCPLTSNPVIAGLFGAFMGATLLAPAAPRPQQPSSPTAAGTPPGA